MKGKKSKKIILFAVLGAVIAAGVYYFLFTGGVEVTAEKAEKGSFHDSFRETGIYTTGIRQNVVTSVSGDVLSVKCKTDTHVDKGDIIAILDSTAYENEKVSHDNLAKSYLAEAENAQKTETNDRQDSVSTYETEMKTAKNTLDSASANFSESQNLFGTGVISEKEFNDAKTEYENANLAYAKAKESYQRAKDRLDELGGQAEGGKDTNSLMAESYRAQAESENRQAQILAGKIESCTVKAPCSGIITSLAIENVTHIGEGETAAVIKTDVGAGIECSVLTTYEPYLKEGDSVNIVQKLRGGDVTRKGHITHIDQYAEQNTSAIGLDESRVKVKTEPDESIDQVKDGYEFEVEFFTCPEKDDVISVPNSAVFKDAGNDCVFEIRGGKAVKTQIESGHRGNSRTEVLSGVSEGDSVIINANTQDLEDGVRVSEQ